MQEEPEYDFICLCCGGRNGERNPFCSFHKYVKDLEGPIDDEEYLKQLGDWLGSEEYKGSVMVPPGFVMSKEYRFRLVEMTDPHRKSRSPGVLLFTLPGIDVPGTINLLRFMN